MVVVGFGVGSWAGFRGLEKEIDAAPCFVSVSLPVAASPTSEFREEGIQTPVALLQKRINRQLFLSYKYYLTCLLEKARSVVYG